jgi:hypothetical protein
VDKQSEQNFEQRGCCILCGEAEDVMSFWEMLGLVSAVAAILGVFLTIYAIINNRTMKEEFRLTREMMREDSRSAKEILDRMDRGHQEATKYLADLIRGEGERTRQTVRTPS